MSLFKKSDEHGLWFNFVTFTHPGKTRPDVTLLPVAHVAEKKFLNEVAEQEWFADTLLFEGGYMPFKRLYSVLFPIAAFVMRLDREKSGAWRLFKRRKGSPYKRPQPDRARERIICSECHCGKCKTYKVRRVWADLDKAQTLAAVKNISLYARILFPFFIILSIVVIPFVISREFISDVACDDDCNCDDCKDGFLNRLMEHYFSFALDARDAYLQKVLAFEIDFSDNKDKQIYVHYGAAHMPSLHKMLTDGFGYEVKSSRSVLAVARDKKTQSKSDINFGYGQALIDWEARIQNSSDAPKNEGLTMSFTKAKAVLEAGDSYQMTINTVPKDIVDIYQTIPDHKLAKAS